MAKGNIIRDRIVELRRVRAGDLLADPRNWRKHPKAQRDALADVLGEKGYAGALLVRETPDGLRLIDGHLRAELDPNQVVPVLVLDLDEAEAGKLLATLDPLGAMATVNHDALQALLKDVSFDNKAINEMLAALVVKEMQPLQNMPILPEGDKSAFGQMTFTVTEVQRVRIERGLAAVKRIGSFADTGNENSNGNALAFLAETFLKEHGNGNG